MISNLFPSPSSLTHQHLFACLNTLLPKEAMFIRVLDAGCGNGKLISFIHRAFKSLRPNMSIEIYGFDVVDHGVQEVGFLEKTIAALSSDVSDVPWSDRIKPLYVNDAWNFPDKYFDFVLSNQVLEHLHDKHYFFKESSRVLRDGGYAVHLAPLVHCIYEGHLFLPWAHRIRSHDLLCSYISMLSRLGLGIFHDYNKNTGISKTDFSIKHADYIHFWTKYMSESKTLDIARDNKFRATFKFSYDFYLLKLRQLFHLPYRASYNLHRIGLLDSVAIKFLRYISSCTLVCEKRNIYK